MTTSRCTRIGRMVATAVLGAMFWANPAAAHDDIESSSPADQAVLTEPIAHVDIDFGVEVGEGTTMFLTFDRGDGEIIDIGGDTTITGTDTARLTFPEINRPGTYSVRYLAPVPADGHVLAGSVSFSWGGASASNDGRGSTSVSFVGLDIILTGIGIALIAGVGVGIWLFSRRSTAT